MRLAQRGEFVIRSGPDGLYQRYYIQYLENLLDIVAEDVAARFRFDRFDSFSQKMCEAYQNDLSCHCIHQLLLDDRFRSYFSILAFDGKYFHNHAKRCKPVLSVLPHITSSILGMVLGALGWSVLNVPTFEKLMMVAAMCLIAGWLGHNLNLSCDDQWDGIALIK